MAETFDYVATNAATTSGANLAGDTFTQSAVSKFVPACYLVYGAAGGPYERVDTATPLPVTIISGTPSLNCEYADGATWSDGSSKNILSGGVYQATPQTIADGKVGPVQVTANGYQIVYVNAGSITANAGTNLNTSALALESGGNLAAIAASASVMDDWDETNRCAVNLIASQVAITGGAGAVAANTPRVTLASDDPAVASLSVLDDWDETNRCAVNIISGQAGVAAGAGAVGATVPRVTLASDDPAVAKLGTIDTDTGNIATSCALLDNTVYVDDADWTDGVSSHQLVGGLYQSVPQSITDGDVGPLQVTQNGYLIVSLASAQTLATVTNVATIGTSITPGTSAAHLGKAEDASHSSGDTGVMALAVRNDTHTAAISGTDGDYTPLGVDSSGKLGIRGTFAEDAAHTSGDLGVQVLTVRQDTAAALAGTDADYQPLITDSSGRLHVNVGSLTAGTSATSLGKAEDAAHSSGDTGVMALAVANSTHTTAISGTDGDYTPLAVDTTGKLGIRGTFAEDSAHASADLGLQVLTVRTDTAIARSGTDGDYQPFITDDSGRLHVNVGAMTPGTASTSLGKAVDNAAGGTDTGIAALVVRDDALTTLTPADGDYTTLRVTSTGAMWVQQADGVAHDAADSGNPLKIGAKASTSAPTAVSAANDRVNLWATLQGALVTVAPPVSVDVNAAVAADVDAAVAAATGLRLMGYSVSEQAAGAAECEIVNGATGAAGTPIAYVQLAANGADTQWFGPQGLPADSGISIDHIAGTFDIVLYYMVLT